MQNGAFVELHLRGIDLIGKANRIDDHEQILAIIRAMRDVRGERYMQRMGFSVDDPLATKAEVLQALRETIFIEIRLQEESV